MSKRCQARHNRNILGLGQGNRASAASLCGNKHTGFFGDGFNSMNWFCGFPFALLDCLTAYFLVGLASILTWVVRFVFISTFLPFSRLVNLALVPMGKLGWAAVMSFVSKVSPLAVSLP